MPSRKNEKSRPSREECLTWLREHPGSVASGQEVEVDRFQPRDAEGVARLYHAIWGETFPLDYVYDPERIRDENVGGALHQFVARTDSGDIVGVGSLFRAMPGRGMLESGGLMILPDYRMGMLLFQLKGRMMHAAREELGLNAVFGQSVTDHLTTQKLNRRHGFLPTCFELEAMAPRPEGDSVGTGGGRISLLDEFLVFRDIPHAVHLPPPYAGVLRAAQARLGLARTELAPGACVGPGTVSVWSMAPASLAKMTVEVPGDDLADAVATMETGHAGWHVFQVLLPLSHPGVGQAVEMLRGRGYFLGGLLPLWTDRDVLLMQKIATPGEGAQPQLLTEDARAVMESVTKDKAEVSAMQAE